MKNQLNHHKMNLGLSLLSAFAISFLASVSFGRIQVISAGSYGPGCPTAGSATIQLAPDNTSVTILYNDMKVSSENKQGYTGLDCRSDIDFRIPVGMQLELRTVDYRGFLSLSDQNISGRINSVVCFKGGAIEYSGQRTRMPGCTNIGGFGKGFVGPITDEFFFKSGVTSKDAAGREVTVRNLSRCSGVAKLRIKTTVSTTSNSTDSFGEISLDSADFQFSQKYNLFLAPCDKDNQRVERICRQGTCQEYDIR